MSAAAADVGAGHMGVQIGVLLSVIPYPASGVPNDFPILWANQRLNRPTGRGG